VIQISEISDPVSEGITKAREKRLLSLIRQNPVPRHIAIIMDGNRRFAKELGMDPTEGHLYGREKLKEVLEWCLEVDIKVLTVYAFSTENFNRSPDEVGILMELFERNFKILAEDERVKKNHIKVTVLGQIDLLPPSVREAIADVMEKTKHYDKYFYNMCVAYGGRQEIVSAIRRICSDVKDGKFDLDNIDEQLVSSYLYTKQFPDPDLVIWTSGEARISNFLLWQSAYSEFYFTDIYWPGFQKVDFFKAIRDYQMRRRRYGA